MKRKTPRLPVKRKARAQPNRSGKKEEFYVFRNTSTSKKPRVQELTLLEQVHDKKKSYVKNLQSTLEALSKELDQLTKQRSLLLNSLKTNSENVTAILQKDREIMEVQVKLRYLSSGEGEQKLNHCVAELDEQNKMIAKVEISEASDSGVVFMDDSDQCDPSQFLRRHKQTQVTPCHKTNPIMMVDDTNSMSDEKRLIIREFDVENSLDPISYALRSAPQMTTVSHQRHVCGFCGQPMQTHCEKGIIFCLFCGCQISYNMDLSPLQYEEPRSTKAPSNKTKEDGRINGALGDQKQEPYVDVSHVDFLGSVRREQEIQCIRSRKFNSSEHMKACLNADGVITKPNSVKHQIATYMNGIPPDYYTKEEEALLVSEMKKNPPLVGQIRALKRKLLSGQTKEWTSNATDFIRVASQLPCHVTHVNQKVVV